MAKDDADPQDKGSRRGPPDFVDRDDDQGTPHVDFDYDDDFPQADAENDDEAPDPGYAAFADELEDPLADWPAPDSKLEDLPEVQRRTSKEGPRAADAAPKVIPEAIPEPVAKRERTGPEEPPASDPDNDDFPEAGFFDDPADEDEPPGLSDGDEAFDTLSANQLDEDRDEATERRRAPEPDLTDRDDLEAEPAESAQVPERSPSAEGVVEQAMNRYFGEAQSTSPPPDMPDEEDGEDDLPDDEDEFVDDFLNDLDDYQDTYDEPGSAEDAGDPLMELTRDQPATDEPPPPVASDETGAAGEATRAARSDGRVPDTEERTLPWGMIAVILLALGLLGAGGWGVIKQRSALEAQIRELQAQLATALGPEEAAAERERQRQIELANESLEAELDALQAENAALSAQIAELEERVAERQAAAEAEAERAAAAEREAAAAARRAEEQRAAAAQAATPASSSAGPWFVNFGSYAQREVADRWAQKLPVSEGKVVVQEARAAGKTLYRVRVVGLPSQDRAESVATALERQYQLPRLWVGKN